jgi:hypothetical protein
MNRHDLEEKLPTMTQEQLVDTVKTCLDMIERLEEDLKAGSTKLEIVLNPCSLQLVALGEA